jgi:tellurite resistance-related uncharacterized protein
MTSIDGCDVPDRPVRRVEYSPGLPLGVEYVRTTDVFDNATVPAGLLRAHRIADGIWGRLVVHTGTVTFVFDDEPDQPIAVSAGASVAIPPGRQHHLEPNEPATFAIEFHRTHLAAHPDPRVESTGLDPS